MSGYQIPGTLWAHLGWGGRRVDPRDPPPSDRWHLVQETPERWRLETYPPLGDLVTSAPSGEPRS